MNVDDLFPSPYLKASDVQHKPVVTIARIDRERMKNREGKEEVKPVLFFKEYEKGIVLNRTNADVISGLYGRDVDDWTGKRIQLESAMVSAFGETKAAIRVCATKPALDKGAIVERYQALFEKARGLNLPDMEYYVIDPAKMTAEEIADTGKRLRAKVDAAEIFS